MPAELAVSDGMPPPDDLPRGEFWATSLADGGIRIDRADPRILISAEVLDAIVKDCWQGGSFSPEPPNAWLDLAGCTTYDGALLKINGVNRKVVYRIVTYVPRVRGFIAEWPD